MHEMEKATEQVMWGVQLTYNVQIVEEGFLHEVRRNNKISTASYVTESIFGNVWLIWKVSSVKGRICKMLDT